MRARDARRPRAVPDILIEARPPTTRRTDLMPDFKLVSDFQPTGDQPQAIDALVAGLERGDRAQTLLGVTG